MTREEIEYKDALIYASELENVPLYLGYSSRVTPKNFYNTMEEVRNRYGVQIGVFDNLQRLVRTGEEKDMGQASGIFKDITMDLNMPFILVSQPRKLNRDRNPTIDDLKGSGAIPADADEVLLLYRKRVSAVDGSSQSLDPMTKIIIDKSRYSAGGSRILRFVGEKSRFEEEE
jgi:replicative DNA helicase